MVEAVVYTLFGSGEEQSWNRIEENPGESQPLNKTIAENKAEEKKIEADET